jgi:hypothetical protein
MDGIILSLHVPKIQAEILISASGFTGKNAQ